MQARSAEIREWFQTAAGFRFAASGLHDLSV